MTHSVVKNSAAIDAAFCRAERVTFGGVDDAGLDEVLVVTGRGVEAGREVLEVADLVHHDATFEASVHGDLVRGCFDGLGHNAPVDSSPISLSAVSRMRVWLRSNATPPPGTTPSSIAALVVDGVLDAVLLLLQLHLGCGADLDDGHTTGQLREALLELLTVVVRVGVLDLCLDLVDPALDVVVGARTFHDGRFVLVDHDLARATQQLQLRGVELEPDLLGDDGATGQDRDVLEHGLARSPKPGALTATDLKVPRIC